MIKKPFWTTANGEKIAYEDLTDSHLKNIIKDGYRSKYILDEAERREFKVPMRKVDKLSFQELCVWLESFASCALAGDTLGEKMTRLWDEDKAVFLLYLNRILEREEKKK